MSSNFGHRIGHFVELLHVVAAAPQIELYVHCKLNPELRRVNLGDTGEILGSCYTCAANQITEVGSRV